MQEKRKKKKKKRNKGRASGHCRVDFRVQSVDLSEMIDYRLRSRMTETEKKSRGQEEGTGVSEVSMDVPTE